MFKLQLTFAIFTVAATLVASQGFFQPITPNGVNYHISGFKLNWFEAVAVCRSFGADLVNIESETEMTAISNQLKATGRSNDRFWIDSNDLSTPFQFYSFTTGRRVAYTKWSPRQPDNLRNNERCVSLWLTRDDAGEFRMNDAVCLNQDFFICKERA